MRTKGFTLVELLVAVTIFAVLAAIAAPIYTEYTERSYRGELQADMLGCAQALERFNAATFSYVGVVDTDADGLANPGSTNGPIGTDICNPLSVAQGRYALAVVVTANTFDMTATPQVGPMAGDGIITLDEAGVRRWDENDDGVFQATENDWVDDDI